MEFLIVKQNVDVRKLSVYDGTFVLELGSLYSLNLRLGEEVVFERVDALFQNSRKILHLIELEQVSIFEFILLLLLTFVIDGRNEVCVHKFSSQKKLLTIVDSISDLSRQATSGSKFWSIFLVLSQVST